MMPSSPCGCQESQAPRVCWAIRSRALSNTWAESPKSSLGNWGCVQLHMSFQLRLARAFGTIPDQKHVVTASGKGSWSASLLRWSRAKAAKGLMPTLVPNAHLATSELRNTLRCGAAIVSCTAWTSCLEMTEGMEVE